MVAEVLGDFLAHVDADGFGAEDADLEILSGHQAHRGWCQRYHDGLVLLGLGVSYGELAPGSVDGGVEKTELEVRLDSDVLGQAMGVAGGRLDEYILAIEPQSFVGDFCGLHLKRTQALHRIYEQLLLKDAMSVCLWADKAPRR